MGYLKNAIRNEDKVNDSIDTEEHSSNTVELSSQSRLIYFFFLRFWSFMTDFSNFFVVYRNVEIGSLAVSRSFLRRV